MFTIRNTFLLLRIMTLPTGKTGLQDKQIRRSASPHGELTGHLWTLVILEWFCYLHQSWQLPQVQKQCFRPTPNHLDVIAHNLHFYLYTRRLHEMDAKQTATTVVGQDPSNQRTRSSMTGDVEIGTSYEPVDLKRDLGSRHINMIAIAGMIVSLSITSHSRTDVAGYWPIPGLRPNDRGSWTRWSSPGLHLDGHGGGRCVIYDWRSYRFLDRDWWLHPTCHTIC